MLDYLKLLDYAKLAYTNHESYDNIFRLTFESVDNGVDYYIGIRENTLLLSFRGTDEILDVITDLHFWQKEVPSYESCENNPVKIKVHSGFYNAYNNPKVKDEIRKYIGGDIREIYVTGHSYGAALALLCASDLQYAYPNLHFEVVVFGCPRIGNKAWEIEYSKRLINTVRFENGNDLVTKIPFAIMGFRHTRFKIHIGKARMPLVYSLSQHDINAYRASFCVDGIC
ncbi:MAG: lipase family protein [Clostridiales bacterium]|jgi:predicted lipase|nr:lipase family protein [Clostridiales bacterium]